MRFFKKKERLSRQVGTTAPDDEKYLPNVWQASLYCLSKPIPGLAPGLISYRLL